MTMFALAEEAIFSSPKDTSNQPSPQKVADLFKMVNAQFETVAIFTASLYKPTTNGELFSVGRRSAIVATGAPDTGLGAGYAYLSNRSSYTMQWYVDNSENGHVFQVAGLFYQIDTSLTGADSCTNDLSVDNIKPHILSPTYAEHFGAVGDGVTDDAPAIQAGLDYLNGDKGSLHLRNATYSTGATLNGYFGMAIVGDTARHQKGTIIKPTSAVSRGISIVEKDSGRIEHICLDMSDMSARLTYTASTISFDAATNTINDSANGLGSFERGEVIQVTSGATNRCYNIKDVSAGTITLHHLDVTAAAGSSVTIDVGACGFWGNGTRRNNFEDFHIFMGDSGKGWVGFNGHDGLRSKYYNRHIGMSIKPNAGITEGVCWAISSTAESGTSFATSNYFQVCIAQAADFGWLIGETGAGFIMMNCHGESANTLGLFVEDTSSANNTAVKAYGGEWSDVDAGKAGALHMIGSTVNGTVGSNVLEEYFGRFLNQPVLANRVQIDDTTIQTTGTNEPLQLYGNGTEGVVIGAAAKIARTNSIQGGGLEVYRASSSGAQGVFNVYSDVGGVKTVVGEWEADGSVLSANNDFSALSDRKMKKNIEPAKAKWSDFMAVDFKKYHYNAQSDDDRKHPGVIAQDMEKGAFKDYVKKRKNDKADFKTMGKTTLSFNYSGFNVEAMMVIQEAQERIEALEAKIEAMA